MSSSLVGRKRAPPANYLSPSEKKHRHISKITRIVLATIATIASYVFLPIIGATIASSIVVAFTQMSFYDANISSYFEQSPYISIPINMWREMRSPSYKCWKRMGKPKSIYQWSTKDARINIDKALWDVMGRPSYDFWIKMNSPKSCIEWNNEELKNPKIRLYEFS